MPGPSLPYLVRRGDAWCFRLSIPPDLQPILERTAITRSLGRVTRLEAAAQSLVLAQRLKVAFARARQLMPSYKDDPSFKHLIQTQLRIAVLTEERDEARQASDAERAARLRIERQASAEAEAAARKARIEVLDAVRALQPAPIQVAAHPAASRGRVEPTVGDVIDQFLSAMESRGQSPMLKKHRTCLPMFRTTVGHLRTSELKQAHLNEFFDLLLKLPPNWTKAAELRDAGWVAAAHGNSGPGIAQATFDGTYRASISMFLKWAIGNFQDEGLSPHLTLDHVRYTGTRAEGEHKQRPLTAGELRRLFQGDELRRFATDGAEVHKFWILAVALYTGARIRELCQINPQKDWLCVDGIQLLSINESTESDAGVVKSVKNKTSVRTVPLHPALVSAGFLAYLDAVRSAGAKRLFPQWPPKGGKASWRAEEWIRTFFDEVGVRDDTPGQRVVGAHAFRSTFIEAAVNAGVEHIGTLTGHAGELDPQVASYAGGSNAIRPDRKLKEISKVHYALELPHGALPSLPQTPRAGR